MKESLFSFELDHFQKESCRIIDDQSKNLLVSAPTSSGKTAIAEYAISRALTEKKKPFILLH